MEVIVIERNGPEALKSRQQPIPIPKDDEVVIEVVAIGVNKLDKFRTHDSFRMLEHWSNIPGLECTGTVIKTCRQVNKWKVGEKACALLNGGGYAQAVAVPAAQVLPFLSVSTSKSHVACLPHAVCMAWEALIRLGNLSQGMSLLVYGRCGRICEMAVQLAKMVNAKVIVATPDRKWSGFKHQPDFIIDSKCSDFDKLVLEAIPTGVDIVLDSGISNFWNCKMFVKSEGTILLVDTYAQSKSNSEFHHLFQRNLTFHVIDRRFWTQKYTAEVVGEVEQNLWPAFKQGEMIVPDSAEVFTLSNVVEAHRYTENDELNNAVLVVDKALGVASSD